MKKNTDNTKGANSKATTKVVEGITALADEALAVIQNCLHSPDEQIQLKAACWITDKIEGYGAKLAKLKEAATNVTNWDSQPTLQMDEYKESAMEYGLQSFI